MARAWEDRWILGQRLGHGGQGFTFVATQREDPAIKGALKYLKNNSNSQARGRMRREVVNLQTLAKGGAAVPNVLDHNTDHFEDTKTELYVVMDLIHGDTLSAYVSSQRVLSVQRAVQFTLSVCKTVERAHKAQILHRDLKPENIIVRNADNCDLVVVDYGLSFNASDEDLTQTDETFRNRFLDLPETNTPNGDLRDKRSDLSAVCGILWFCLSGNRPGQLQDGSGSLPHRRKGFALREKHDDHRIAAIEEFLDRGFAPVVANRYQTVEEMQQRLCEFLVSNKERDLSDPFQLAAHLSAELRAKDRKTQIAEFRTEAQKVFEYLAKDTQKYANKLGRFKLTNFGGGMFYAPGDASSRLPEGLDLVQMSPVPLLLQADHHPFQRFRQYAVAVRGEQCVLLAGDWKANPQPGRPMHMEPKLSWQEVASYEGSPETAFNLVSINLREWVTAQLKELHQEIAPQ